MLTAMIRAMTFPTSAGGVSACTKDMICTVNMVADSTTTKLQTAITRKIAIAEERKHSAPAMGKTPAPQIIKSRPAFPISRRLPKIPTRIPPARPPAAKLPWAKPQSRFARAGSKRSTSVTR